MLLTTRCCPQGHAGKGDEACADCVGTDGTGNPDQDRHPNKDRQVFAVDASGGGADSVSGGWQRSSAGKRVIHLGKGRGLTGLGNTGQRMLVIDVEPNKLVHRESPVQVTHGAFKRPRILPAARRLRFHSLCRLNRGSGTWAWRDTLQVESMRIGAARR